MTLLVGMVGSDGIVLAADQLIADFAKDEKTFDDFRHARKIESFEEAGIACAYCGDKYSNEIGAKIRSKFANGLVTDIQAALRQAGEQAMIEAYETARNGYSIHEIVRSLFVVFYGKQTPQPQLWELAVESRYNAGNPVASATATQITGKRITGSAWKQRSALPSLFQT